MRYLTLIAMAVSLASCTNTKNPAPVTNYGSKPINNAGVHIVKDNDTVFSIANRYELSMPALISKNGIPSPYVIHTGQRLILPPPNTYKVRQGDSLYTVSRTFGVDMSRLSRMNDLRAPYRIFPNDILKIPDGEVIAAARPQQAVVSQKVAPSLPPQKTAVSQPKAVQKAPPARASNGRFGWPLRGKVLSEYGPKPGGLHNDGINIAGKRGDPISAAENGVVVYTGDDIGGFGNLILIRHADRYMSAYGHLDKINVRKGDTITKGQTIGQLGSTGHVDSPQLHFEIRRGTKALNPQQYL